jgi:hypothetical protein
MVAECYRELKLENLPHFDLVVSEPDLCGPWITGGSF